MTTQDVTRTMVIVTGALVGGGAQTVQNILIFNNVLIATVNQAFVTCAWMGFGDPVVKIRAPMVVLKAGVKCTQLNAHNAKDCFGETLVICHVFLMTAKVCLGVPGSSDRLVLSVNWVSGETDVPNLVQRTVLMAAKLTPANV